MSEVKKQIDLSNTNQSAYFTKKRLNFFKENFEHITGKEIEDVKNFQEFFELAVERALDNTEPLQKKFNAIIEKKEADFIEEINKLKSELDKVKQEDATGNEIIIGLREQLDKSTNELTTLQEQNDKLTTEIAGLLDLQNELTAKDRETTVKSNLILELNQEIENLHKELKSQKLTENQVIVNLSDFHLQLFRKLISNQLIQNSFSKINASGKMSGVFDIVHTKDEKRNLANLMTTVTVGSAANMVIKPVIDKNLIQKEIKKFISK